MLKSAAVDRKTLAWIRVSVDETLESVLQSLDRYSENTDDATPVKACIAPLHRVKGAVEMVGIEGATMLASELEMLAHALAGNLVKNKKEAAEVLAAGIFQLPGYLESLYHGHPDLPLALLPILNDIRASQDKELFTEGDFFSPGLSVNVPVQPLGKNTITGDVVNVARKVRPGYLSGLLGVFKNDNVTESLEKITLVLDSLLNASTSKKSEQLWWAALGVVDSLRDHSLDTSIAVKILLGRVDREIKRIIKSGVEIDTEDSLNKTINSLLYYISLSENYNDRVVEIKKSFALVNTDKNSINKARENLYGFNVNLVDGITRQLTEELITIKCELDILLHGQAGSTEGIAAVLKNFSAVGEALEMLGMSKQKKIILEQKEFLTLKISRGETLEKDDLLGVATALLNIESCLGNLGNAIYQPDCESSLSPAEYEEMLKLVAHEILTVIDNIKEEIIKYSIDPSNTLLLRDVPDQLRTIAGVSRTINDEFSSNLSRAISHYVDQELILNKTGGSSKDSFDLLADSITGLENYYQAIIEESVAPEFGLKVATHSITQLGYPPEKVNYTSIH